MTDETHLKLFLNKHIDKTGKNVWDEWSFYSNFKEFNNASDFLIKNINSKIDIHSIDYVFGLSKSGLPLAAIISSYLKKPLIPFSIGEFFSPEGEVTIGIPELGGIELKDKKILVCDSHMRSGETYRLFKKIIKPYEVGEVVFAILADCHNEQSIVKKDYEENGVNYKDTVTFFNPEEVKKFLDDEVGPSQDDPVFWKHSRELWLIPLQKKTIELESVKEEGKKIEYIDENLKKITSEKLIFRDNFDEECFNPLRLYVDADLYGKVINQIEKKIKTTNIDTVVACSLSAIPLAVTICKLICCQKSDIFFIYLGNGDKKYYQDKFKKSKNILFCDDIISSGALLYKAYNAFINGSADKKLWGVIVLMNIIEYPFRKYVNSLLEKTEIYSVL